MEATGGNATSFQLRDTKVDVEPSQVSSNSSTDLSESYTGRSVCSICLAGVDLANHILIVCLTVFTLYHSLDAMGPFNLHVTLCTVGYVLLMSEAIVVFAGDSILTNFLTHRAKRHVHWILQILGVICTVSGVAIMFRAKVNHFRSTHAILGIASVVIMLFLTLFGYPVFIAAKLRNVIRPVVIKFGHNFFGLSCFAIGMASQYYGYKKFRALDFFASADIRLICGGITAAIAILSACNTILLLASNRNRCTYKNWDEMDSIGLCR